MPKIAFLISSPVISGGINVIFRHAMELVERGYTVAIVCKTPIENEQIAWHPIFEIHHQNLLWLDYHQISEHHFDLAFATWWVTFFELWKIQSVNYAYFVQSIESRFYPPHDAFLRAAVDSSYDFPIGFVTEAKWIKDYLRKQHSQSAFLAVNGVDKTIYAPQGEALASRIAGKLRVLVEGPIDVEFKNVPAAIRLAREGGADEVWLLTSSLVQAVPGVDRVFSRVPQHQTASIYRSCDVLLKLSFVEGMFGPPLEMFHCGGTTIVYNVTGHDEYIVHGKNGLVAEMSDEQAVRKYLSQLKNSPALLESLKNGALQTALNWPNWKESSEQFHNAVVAITAKPSASRAALRTYSRRIWLIVEMHWKEIAALKNQYLTESEATRLILELNARQAAEREETRLVTESKVIQAQAEAFRLNDILTQVLHSSSWRLTRPIRVLKRMMTEKGFARHLLSVIRNRFF